MNMGSYDCIVIGSGPAGATLARELSRGGQRVLILERGSSTPVRTPLLDMVSTARIVHLGRGATLVSGSAVGGTSLLYYATGNEPPLARFRTLGIDLAQDYQTLQGLLPMAPLRDDLVGPMARRICQSAHDLGIGWKKLPKLIDQAALGPGEVGQVMEKSWRADAFVREAVAKGALLLERAEVERVLTDGRRAYGVEYRQGGGVKRALGARIVVAAGGARTPALLHRCLGTKTTGGFFCDPVIVVSGEVDGLVSRNEAAMVYGAHLEDEQVFLADLKLPPSLFMAGALLALRPDRLFSHRKSLSLMVKAADEVSGSMIGPMRKAFSGEDLSRLERGAQVAEAILRHAGAGKVFRSRITSAHPGGTMKIGRQLGFDLNTEIDNLYVCDGSVLPAPWGLPPTTTLMCLALRLSRHLLSQG